MATTLYITDLDGTLLQPDATVSDTSVQLLNRAIGHGALFSIATARTPATVVPLMSRVDMRLPGVVFTGAALWHFDTARYSDLRLMDADKVLTVNRLFDDAGLSPFIYTQLAEGHLDVYYPHAALSPVDAAFVAQRNHSPLKTFHIGTPLPPTMAARTLIFFASGTMEQTRAVSNAITAATDCHVSCYEDIYNPGCGLVEVFEHNISKSEAILRLKRHVGADRLVVFGDNLNDLDMFAVADRAIAVENALPAVRAAAHTIIGPNTANSVPNFIYNNVCSAATTQ